MNVTTTPVPRSSVLLEVELPPERLERAVDDAVRRLARRTKVAGFRPGKAPRFMLERVLGPGAILDEAMDHLVEDAYREAILESTVVPLTNPDVEVVQAEEGKPVIFKATVQVRPEVTLGDYRNFNFRPDIETIDDARVDQVIDELRDQNATLAPLEDRGAQDGDYAVVGFVGTGRRDLRGRDVGADAADHRAGAPHPRLRGASARNARRGPHRVRHRLPGRLPG
jgi:trigger factor